MLRLGYPSDPTNSLSIADGSSQMTIELSSNEEPKCKTNGPAAYQLQPPPIVR